MKLLITTGLGFDFSSENEYFLLGKWCYSLNYNSVIENSIMHSYHWDDRLKFNSDYDYLTCLYEKYLILLSKDLNEIHNKREDLRYWRIIIGPWLRFFIDVLFDRFEIIRTLERDSFDSSIVLKYSIDELVPNDFSDFYNQIRYDHWNHAIFSELLQYNGFRIHYSDNLLFENVNSSKRKPSFFNSIKEYLLNFYNAVFFKNLSKVVIIEPYISILKSFKLNMKLLQLPYLGRKEFKNPQYKRSSYRSKTLLIHYSNPAFEKFLNNIIFKLIPSIYLENFHLAERKSFHLFPNDPKLIFTSNAYQSNELFKIWVASMTQKNVPFLIGQHGGHFGIGLRNQTEEHQIMISDKFITWGWRNENIFNIHCLPSMKLSGISKYLYNPKGDILITTPSYPLYFYCSFSVPFSGQFLNIMDELYKLLENIDKSRKEIIKIRTDSDVFGWNIHSSLIKRGFEGLIDKQNISLNQRLKKCKLSISTYNATVFLETISLNIPTIVFFNQGFYEIREDALPFIEELKKVKIYHESPESVAEFLNSIADNIELWWYSQDVQNVREMFCNNYAHSSNDWINDWQLLFNKTIKLND